MSDEGTGGGVVTRHSSLVTRDSLDVDAIERELIRLRRLPENSSPNGDPAARTAVLSLVAYAPSREVLERVVATVEALVNQHPSRTIVVYVDEELPAQRLDARVD